MPDLSDDVSKFGVGGGEGEGALDLDLQGRWGTVPIDGFDDHIVERMVRAPLLKGDAFHGGPRQAARLAS